MESLSQAILVGIILVGRLGTPRASEPPWEAPANKAPAEGVRSRLSSAGCRVSLDGTLTRLEERDGGEGSKPPPGLRAAEAHCAPGARDRLEGALHGVLAF